MRGVYMFQVPHAVVVFEFSHGAKGNSPDQMSHDYGSASCHVISYGYNLKPNQRD